jgi:thiamine biosynthesis lipoprotein ApbE
VKALFSFPAILTIAAALQACPAPATSVTHTGDLAYAKCILALADEAAFNACFVRIGKILREMDMCSADSVIAVANAAAGGKPVRVPDDFWEVLRQGPALAEAVCPPRVSCVLYRSA